MGHPPVAATTGIPALQTPDCSVSIFCRRSSRSIEYKGDHSVDLPSEGPALGIHMCSDMYI